MQCTQIVHRLGVMSYFCVGPNEGSQYIFTLVVVGRARACRFEDLQAFFSISTKHFAKPLADVRQIPTARIVTPSSILPTFGGTSARFVDLSQLERELHVCPFSSGPRKRGSAVRRL